MRMVISKDQTYYYTSGCGCWDVAFWGTSQIFLWKKYDHPVVDHDDLMMIHIQMAIFGVVMVGSLVVS